MPEFPEADRPMPDGPSGHGPRSARLPGPAGTPDSAPQPQYGAYGPVSNDGQSNAPHPTGPAGSTAGGATGPVAQGGWGSSGAAAYPTGQAPDRTSNGSRRTLATAGSAALLAAALASAGTYGVVKANGGADGAIETGNKTVLNADPKDFADAGTVNWSATAAKVNPSVVAITVQNSSGDGDKGSGVILDAKGNIVTNNHVVAAGGHDGQVKVTLSNNRTYSADVVGTDPGTDLAVIRIKNVDDLQPVAMGDDSKLVVGQPVMAVGNPLGLAGTVTTGIVSALNRPVKTAGESSDSSSGGTSDDAVFTNAIQTSAAINPGNSGGALVDGSGKLIGINSSIASLSSGESGGQSGNIGIGFAIPAVVVKNISGQLISKGKAQHALLGIATKDDSVHNDGAELSAAKVASVEKGGAADKAGVKTGDEVISIDGQPVTSSDALVGAVRARTVGSKVMLTILRNGQKKDVEVTLGSKESK